MFLHKIFHLKQDTCPSTQADGAPQQPCVTATTAQPSTSSETTSSKFARDNHPNPAPAHPARDSYIAPTPNSQLPTPNSSPSTNSSGEVHNTH